MPLAWKGMPPKMWGYQSGVSSILFFKILRETIERDGLADEIGPDVHLALDDVAAVDEDGKHRDDEAQQDIPDVRMQTPVLAWSTVSVRSADAAPFGSRM